MKNLFLLVVSLSMFSTLAFSQKEEYKEPKLPIDQDTKLITYTKVIDVTANKDSLFKKGKKWFYTFYKNPTSVIKEEDAANGKIVGKHQVKVLNPADKKGIQTMRGIVKYAVTTQFKENKARIVISEINLENSSYTPIEKWLDKTAPGFTTKNYYYLTQLDSLLNDVELNFEKFIKEATKVKKDDW
jgi:hypothetical protein